MLTGNVRVIFDRFPEIIARTAVAGHEAAQETAQQIQQDAQTRAPVLTGALRNSIHTEVAGATTVNVVTGVNYAIYQEYGTRKMAANPFMGPAGEAAKPGHTATVIRHMGLL